MPATVDPQALIGNTVHNPASVKPLREEDCRVAIPKANFFIVGGAKCGSTMLTSILHGHPDCCHSRPKETNYFSMNFDQGWDWYRGTFAHYDGEPVIGEASVSYGSIPFRKNVAGQLHEYNPDAKIIYVVRHPYRKLVSGWKMATSGEGFVSHASAMQGFEQYVLHEEERADDCPWDNPTHGWDAAAPSSDRVTRVWLDALYFEGQVNSYRQYFADDQIKVMFLQDWKHDPDGQSRELCQFLELDPARLSKREEKVNSAEERRKHHPLFRWFANSSTLRPFRHMFPKDLRHSVRRWIANSPLGSTKLKYPDFHISDEFRDKLIPYLKAKSAPLLAREGKPADFWDFDNIA